MTRTAGPAPSRKGRRKALSTNRLDQLVEEATVDAYDESEQKVGFCTMLEEHLGVPFATQVLGVDVVVERVDLSDDGGIMAVCRRGRARQRISILDLPLPDPPPDGAEWIEAYRRWVSARV